MLTLLLEGKLFLAPINSAPQQVLDVGTGTGIWAMYIRFFFSRTLQIFHAIAFLIDYGLTPRSDFADEHPSAIVTGTDLSPIQPTWVPPNVKFEIDDAQDEWTWPDNHFDFIHMRCLMGSMKDWPYLYSQAFRSFYSLLAFSSR